MFAQSALANVGQDSTTIYNTTLLNTQHEITIYYRWDKHNLDKKYLTNTLALNEIDSIMQRNDAKRIDSLYIIAYASPEGAPDYNKRLSLKRALTLKNYILNTYSWLKHTPIIIDARGENWANFRQMAIADNSLPMKDEVLSIINDTSINDVIRQRKIVELDRGGLYKNYILPHYYRYLRNGASLFITYNSPTPINIAFEPITIKFAKPIFKEKITIPTIEQHYITTRYPIAIRTNLLYDAIGAMNVGVELPFGKYKAWSWIIEGAYAFWRSPKNLYALQTLECGTELRYWIPFNSKRKSTNANWQQPLKGFYVGVYGNYWARYDVQWIDGVQGDNAWSVGLTAGYAIPLNQHFALDLGIGAGFFSTPQYRHYHQPEYDANGKYHLMWQHTGSWSGVALTKLRVSLVWLIQSTKIKKGVHK